MYFLRPIRLGIQSLKLHKLRSLLTVLGVVFGVASVILMLAVGAGARDEALRAIRGLGATNLIVRSVKPTDGNTGGDATGAIRYGLTHSDLARLRHAVPEQTRVAPMREHEREARHREAGMRVRVRGVNADYRALNRIRLLAGRFVEPVDCERQLPVAVLTSSVATNLFPLANPLGNTVRIGEDQYYRVVGIVAPPASTASIGAGLPAQDFRRDVYVPFATDQRRFGENITFDRASGQPPEKVEISQITLAVPTIDDVRPVAQFVESFLRKRHPGGDAQLTVPLDLIEQTEATQRMFSLVLTAIASISLLVGGIGIMNIMLATVTERTREIGIRRALGARRHDIVQQFLIETLVLSSVGGLLGIAAGVAGAVLAERLGGVAVRLTLGASVLAFTISLLVGVVFGLYPARRAAWMDPIDALRHE